MKAGFEISDPNDRKKQDTEKIHNIHINVSCFFFKISVADPECLSPNPDPETKRFRILDPDPHQRI
jgi:hypothetical protein